MTAVPDDRGHRAAARALVAVYPDRSVAVSVRDELVAAGADASAITIGDSRTAARAERTQELDESLTAFPFVAGTQASSAVRIAAVVGVLGLIVGAALGLALFDFGAGWLDALAGAAIVGPLFAVVGGVIGGGMGAESPTREAVAAQRGVPLELVLSAGTSPRLTEVMLRWSPRRLDEYRDGEHVATHVDERPSAAHRLGRGFSDPTSWS